MKNLNTPKKIQEFLDEIKYNSEPICLSPKEVLERKQANCMDGALFAAYALEKIGYAPLILDLRAKNDDDHVIAIYKEKDLWGSIAKSNTTLLRYRDPIYKNIRELVMSYFFVYFNTKGEMTLKEYSKPFNLNKYKDWKTNVSEQISIDLDKAKHYTILKENITLQNAPKYLIDACFSNSDPDGLFKPK